MVSDWPQFVKVVNHCLDQLYKLSGGKSWEELRKQSGHNFNRLLTKITYNSELASEIVYPGVGTNIKATKEAVAADSNTTPLGKTLNLPTPLGVGF